MVRLHVRNHQIVGRTAVKSSFKTREPLVEHASVHRIHYGNLLVENDIRIIRHPVRHDILALEQVDFPVVHTGVDDRIGYKVFPHSCRF